MSPQQVLKRNADIIERHIGMEETPLSISNSTGISLQSVEAIIGLYQEPASHEMIMQSKVNYGYRDWFIYDNWNRLAIQQIAEVLACDTLLIKRRAKFLRLPKKTKIVFKKAIFNYRSGHIVFDTATGIYYLSINEAADSINMKHTTFRNKMAGRRINNTSFIRV